MDLYFIVPPPLYVHRNDVWSHGHINYENSIRVISIFALIRPDSIIKRPNGYFDTLERMSLSNQ